MYKNTIKISDETFEFLWHYLQDKANDVKQQILSLHKQDEQLLNKDQKINFLLSDWHDFIVAWFEISDIDVIEGFKVDFEYMDEDDYWTQLTYQYLTEIYGNLKQDWPDIKVVVVTPDKPAYVTTVSSKLAHEEIRELLDDHVIEFSEYFALKNRNLRRFGTDSEFAKEYNVPICRVVDGHTIRGAFVVINTAIRKVYQEDTIYVDMSDDTIAKIIAYYDKEFNTHD